MKHHIYFDEVQHKYTDDFNNPFISVTTVLDNYHEHFDSKGMAYRCFKAGLRGNPKYKGKTVKMILKEWDDRNKASLIKGTADHDYLEDSVKSSGNYNRTRLQLSNKQIYTVEDVLSDSKVGVIDLNHPKMLKIKKEFPMIYLTFEVLINHGYRILSEVGVYNVEYLISGLIDILAIKDNNFKIIDWKTNNDTIRFDAGYWKHGVDYVIEGYNNTYKKMLTPVTHLDDSVGNHYALQLSMYSRLLEHFELENSGILLYHIRKFEYPDDHNDVILNPLCKGQRQLDTLKIPYLKSEIDDILVHQLQGREVDLSHKLKFGIN